MRLSFPVVSALFLFASSALVQGQTPTTPPAPTPAPPQITDSARRQIIPAPQSRNGLIDAGWLSHHEKNLAAAKAGPVDLLFVGDSITDNYHKLGPAPELVFKPIWDQYFGPHNSLNLGVSGDSTQHVLWRFEHGELDGLAPANIVLLIGTNNTWHDGNATASDVAAGIEAVVLEMHTRMPKAKILALGILPTTVSPDKSAKDQAINAALESYFANSSYTRVLDLKPLFMNADGTVNESLFYDRPGVCTGDKCDPNAPPPPRKVVHPNTQGQLKMAQAVAAALYGTPRS